ncbi:MAG: hypothetical protein ACIAXF_09290 [Phycisphaerales bacterium JB063]
MKRAFNSALVLLLGFGTGGLVSVLWQPSFADAACEKYKTCDSWALLYDRNFPDTVIGYTKTDEDDLVEPACGDGWDPVSTGVADQLKRYYHHVTTHYPTAEVTDIDDLDCDGDTEDTIYTGGLNSLTDDTDEDVTWYGAGTNPC